MSSKQFLASANDITAEWLNKVLLENVSNLAKVDVKSVQAKTPAESSGLLSSVATAQVVLHFHLSCCF